VITGTVFINAKHLAPRPIFDYEVFRQAQPAERFGNLFVYRGQFHLRWLKAQKQLEKAMELIYAAEPDPKTAERLLAEAVESYPEAYPAAIELGNLLAKRGARDEAIRAYEIAKAHAPPNDEIIVMLARQIERLRREPPELLQPVRNPWLE
jgi:tetratricopeptide (TPR) repeat protein